MTRATGVLSLRNIIARNQGYNALTMESLKQYLKAYSTLLDLL